MLIDPQDVSRLCTPLTGVIHVGAHEGQEAEFYRNFTNDVIWIEANPAIFERLRQNVEQFGHLCYNFLADEVTGLSKTLQISSNDGQSSSVLNLKEHLVKHPDVQMVEEVKVQTRTVDDLLQQLNLDRPKYNFINLDVQGVELQVLKGMTQQLQFVDFAYIEVNFIEMYEGCALMNEIDEFLQQYGLTRKILHDTGYGWGDAIYSRAV